MTPLFDKLNLGSVRTIHVLDAPPSFDPELHALAGVRVLREVCGSVAFALAFVKTLAEVEAAAGSLTRAAGQDAVLWMVYPKASSKRYACAFNRDTGWASLGAAGYEPVRQVAIDADWSALRFRQVAFIKTLKRDPQRALSPLGRKKAGALRGA